MQGFRWQLLLLNLKRRGTLSEKKGVPFGNILIKQKTVLPVACACRLHYWLAPRTRAPNYAPATHACAAARGHARACKCMRRTRDPEADARLQRARPSRPE